MNPSSIDAARVAGVLTPQAYIAQLLEEPGLSYENYTLSMTGRVDASTGKIIQPVDSRIAGVFFKTGQDLV